jgi:CDP-glucose 4,6-dehydratase
MTWKNKQVFVTGCTGLLGSWLCRELIDRGANVTGLVRDWVPHSILLSEDVTDNMNVVRGCVEDYQTIERSLNEYEIEVVFHLAAQTIVEIANRNPLSTFESNIKGTWNVLEGCRRVPTIKQIVVASSDKAYGDQPKLPYDESTPLQGTHPYDVSKSCADLICKAYNVSYGLPVCVTRCGNFYGGGDLNWNRLVPGTIRSVYEGHRPIIRSDGTFIRDYFYIKDGVNAYLHLAEKMTEKGIAGESYNFSNELQVPALDIVKSITQLMNRNDLTPTIRGTAKNEIKHQYLSAAKAKKELKWKAQYSLDEGLAETIKWYTDYFKRNGGKK